MRFHRRGVDENFRWRPSGLRQRLKQVDPDAFGGPADITIVERLLRPVFARRVDPAPAGFEHADDAADDPPVVNPCLAARVGGKMRRNLRKLRVRQPELIENYRRFLSEARELQRAHRAKHFMGLDFKIFLRSENVTVKTQSAQGALEGVCERPLAALAQKKLHSPRFRTIDRYRPETGTDIEVIGYNDNERSRFTQSIVRDYIRWFTKVGSVEMLFDVDELRDFRVLLKCLDEDEFETVAFGHYFPDDSLEIEALFSKFGARASDEFVKRYIYKKKRLPNHPEVTFNMVVSCEGDAVKRRYNPQIRQRGRKETGTYRVVDRYGLWLCKDYIPVEHVNDWASSFGSGSNAIVLLHAFVNCQALKLTANRGTIANTDPTILEELRDQVVKIIEQIDVDLENSGLYTVRTWEQEERTQAQEKSEFTRRVKALKSRKYAVFRGWRIFEPRNNDELFGLLTSLVAVDGNLFDFDPLDDNTTKGIDLIVRDKRQVLTEHSLGYAELKYQLGTRFNHAFQYLKWIICWDFDKSFSPGANVSGIVETDTRQLKCTKDSDGHKIYVIDAPKAANKIHVINLKEFLEQKHGVAFVNENLFE